MSGKGTSGGKGNAGVGPKCASHECSELGLHLCGGCMAVRYCSAACQKVHWKQGGHKQECTKGASAGGTEARTEGISQGGECVICYDGDEEPRPIQSGCACRGNAGLAHVECRAVDAAHRMANGKYIGGWTKCGTCEQEFTGTMLLGLAKAWWSRVHHLPEENDERLSAASSLAGALFAKGKFAKAETIYREFLAVRRRVFDPEHEDTLSATGNLATTLFCQGKHAEAEKMHRELHAIELRVRGPEHQATLSTAMNLASALRVQGKHAEAEIMYGQVLSVQRRVLGPEHPSTMKAAGNVAITLIDQRKYIDAETMFREIFALQKRVLGSDHPDTLTTAGNLAVALTNVEKFAEAEAMLRENLTIQQRVLGSKHPDTLRTATNLAACAQMGSLYLYYQGIYGPRDAPK
jgi:tetratricopeptide (TPR) repeat protein